MDKIKEIIENIVKKIKGDPSSLKNFKDDPEKTVESLAGVDIPDGALDKIVDGVKAKLAADDAGGVVDKIKGLFNKD
jgi:hypothetical protein